MEGDPISLTCTTLGSKPAARIRWFRNDKEVQGEHAAPAAERQTLRRRVPSMRHHYSQAAALLCAPIVELFCCSGFLLDRDAAAHSSVLY